MNWNTAELNLLATLAPVAFGTTEDGAQWAVLQDGRSVTREDDGRFLLGDDAGRLVATAETLPDLLGMTYEDVMQ